MGLVSGFAVFLMVACLGAIHVEGGGDRYKNKPCLVEDENGDEISRDPCFFGTCNTANRIKGRCDGSGGNSRVYLSYCDSPPPPLLEKACFIRDLDDSSNVKDKRSYYTDCSCNRRFTVTGNGGGRIEITYCAQSSDDDRYPRKDRNREEYDERRELGRCYAYEWMEQTQPVDPLVVSSNNGNCEGDEAWCSGNYYINCYERSTRESCCATCNRRERESSSIPGCQYGDKVSWCSEGNYCNSERDRCCYTCRGNINL